jgi:hypothetical protein
VNAPASPLTSFFSITGEYYYDPLGFVYWAYPWGEGGLVEESGPDIWQYSVLLRLGQAIRAADDAGEEAEAIQIAVSSGHGIGKSTLVAWIIHWFLSTRANPQVVVTASTEKQLTTKTWREVAKWKRLAINGSDFKWTATKYENRHEPETWYAVAIPWSEANPDAFAGTHDKHVLMIFDEASAIADIIWEVVEGAMTTPGAIWLVFGNPTINTGRFRACFGRFKHRWIRYQIDSRTAKKANKAQIEKWLEDWGEDSDFFRVRCRGVFPRAGGNQFIGSDLVEGARARTVEPMPRAAKRMSVDVARYGDDQSVITRRQGRKCYKQKKFRGKDTMELASIVAREAREYKPDLLLVDGIGIGAGVVDRLRQLGFNVIDVQFGANPVEEDEFYNLRAEAWSEMREWLKTADIPDDPELHEDMIGPTYHHKNKRELLQLERKEDMQRRGLSSPDCADSLAISFAVPEPIEFSTEITEPEHEPDF